MLIGDEVILIPTEGGYQKEKTAIVIKESPQRITVRLKDALRQITFNKETLRGQFKSDRDFPNYKIKAPEKTETD